jgi:hypothetical protein
MTTQKWSHSLPLHLTEVTVSHVRCSPKHILYYMLDAQLFPQPRLLPQINTLSVLCSIVTSTSPVLHVRDLDISSASAHNLQRAHTVILINIFEVQIFPNF